MHPDHGYSRRVNFEIFEMESLMAQGQCRGLKVVKSCSLSSLVQTLLLQDVSFSHNAQSQRRTDKRTTL